MERHAPYDPNNPHDVNHHQQHHHPHHHHPSHDDDHQGGHDAHQAEHGHGHEHKNDEPHGDDGSGGGGHAEEHADEHRDEGSDSDSEDPMELTKVEDCRPACKRFCGEYKVQCSTMTKTATAIVVALLWSTAVTSLMQTILATFADEYKHGAYWLGLFVVSVLVLGMIPLIIFKYERPDDLWAVVIAIEILGHLWGFKVKDLVTYGAYELHYLTTMYDNLTAIPSHSFCDLVEPSLDVDINAAARVQGKDLGFVGFNLDWGSYTHSAAAFDGLDYSNNLQHGPTPAPAAAPAAPAAPAAGNRRGLGGAAAVVVPAPYEGARVDVTYFAHDQHEMGPGKVCAFEYKTASAVEGFRVEKTPRMEYVVVVA
jgi:hypothetical protein